MLLQIFFNVCKYNLLFIIIYMFILQYYEENNNFFAKNYQLL